MDVVYEGLEGGDELRRQGGGHEFGEQFVVADLRVDDVLEAVFDYEAVEVFGGYDQGPRHHHAHALPSVVEIVALEHVVEEGQAAGLSAHRALAEPREPYRAVVGCRVEAGHHAEALVDAVVAYGLHEVVAVTLVVRELGSLTRTDFVTK